MRRSIIFYLLMVIMSLIVAYGIINRGKILETERASVTALTENIQTDSDAIIKKNEQNEFGIFSAVVRHFQEPLARLLLQITMIIIVARIVGLLVLRLGQPAVIGEMLAGLLLGPSFLGYLFPQFFTAIFPEDSLTSINQISQIGLIFFMFVTGMEFDVDTLKQKIHTAVIVSHASIIFPFILGMFLSLYIYREMAPSSVGFLVFSIFMGISMSITAFPVLARIVQERDMMSTKRGSIVLACAATADITAWGILAVVVSIARAGSLLQSVPIIVFAIIYVVFMLKLVRPILVRLGENYSNTHGLSRGIVTFIFIGLFISSLLTESIGIHALFGAFMFGTIMPSRLNIKALISEKIYDVSILVLLPLFFASTGLRTSITLLNQQHLWETFGWIMLTAVVGKFIGSALSAKITGENWFDSITIGTLMNTRGLMELVVLTIGYDLGILSETIFSLLVLMAITTTFMTGPALDLLGWLESKKTKIVVKSNEPCVAFFFGRSDTGVKLLRVITQLFPHATTMGIHFSGKGGSLHAASDNESRYVTAIQEVKAESDLLNKKIRMIYRYAEDIPVEIEKQVAYSKIDFILLGSAKPVFSKDQLGGSVGRVLKGSSCTVAVYLGEIPQDIKRVLILRSSESDIRMLNLLATTSSYKDMKIDIYTFTSRNAKAKRISDDKRRIDPVKKNSFNYHTGSPSEKLWQDPQTLFIMEENLWRKFSRQLSKGVLVYRA